jgi:hypothetical protein
MSRFGCRVRAGTLETTAGHDSPESVVPGIRSGDHAAARLATSVA